MKNAIGTGYVPNPNVSAKLLVKFSGEQTDSIPIWERIAFFGLHKMSTDFDEDFNLNNLTVAWTVLLRNATDKVGVSEQKVILLMVHPT